MVKAWLLINSYNTYRQCILINGIALVEHRQQELPRFHVEQSLRESKGVLFDVKQLERVAAAQHKVRFIIHRVPSLDLKVDAKQFARVK